MAGDHRRFGTNADDQRQQRARVGSPLTSPQWYSFTKLVAVIVARVDSDRT
jgi:hypothetical protein